MINTTDLDEFETSLPGEWLRRDNDDIYSFTTDKMELQNDRLFKQLRVRHAAGGEPESVRYAITVEDDYCGVLLNDDLFIVRRLRKDRDGSAAMEWEDKAGGLIIFERLPHALRHV